MISVTEIFYAHQCEGSGGQHSMYGQPTVFFRLGVGCTLTCKGFGVPVIKDGEHLKDKMETYYMGVIVLIVFIHNSNLEVHNIQLMN